MNSNVRQSEGKAAFTIIELLTVMSIITILFGLLVPAMSLVKRYSKDVKQSAQFHAIEAGLQMFHDDFEGYPPSDTMDRDVNGVAITGNKDYPGAMKLAEAMMGRDLLGFNPYSVFNVEGKNNAINDSSLPDSGKTLYPVIPATGQTQQQINNMRLRKGLYLDVSKITTAKLKDVYSGQLAESLVICDEFPRVRSVATGKRVGLPILYYKANTSSIMLPGSSTLPADEADTRYIYNHFDNQILIDLAPAWVAATDTSTVNPIKTGGNPGPAGFYSEIQNLKVASQPRPYNQDSFILMSAGNDGLYGTNDDVFNFTKE